MAWQHGDKPILMRRAELSREAMNAEWDVPDGRQGGVVRQLRRRSMIASMRAGWFLLLLVAVIFLGLFYYLGQPLWQQHVEGRRATLERLLEEVAAMHNSLSAQFQQQVLNDTTWIAETQLTLNARWVQFSEASTEADAADLADTRWVFIRWDDTMIAPEFAPNSEDFLGFFVVSGDARDAVEQENSIRRYRVRRSDHWGNAFGEIVSDGRQLVTWESLLHSHNEPGNYVDQRVYGLLLRQPVGDLTIASPELLQVAKEIAPLRDEAISNQNILTAELLRVDASSPVFLENERVTRTFRDFMVTCRGNPESNTNVSLDVTLACTQAYQAQLAMEEDNIWEILARQVPPGILLLFLLVTLGGLYRYNMRLASFHHSRADLLELAAMGRETDKPLSDEEWKNIRESAASLAADMVEFGTSKAGIGPQGVSFEVAKKAESG